MVFIFGTGQPPTPTDLLPRHPQDIFIRCILPQHQLLNNLKQPLPLLFLRFLGWEKLRVTRWVIYHLRKNHRPRRRQGSPRPPQVQCTRVSMANRLFSSTGFIDCF
nr:hypothetical protein [Anthocerotibacter panamensis]